MTKAKSLKIEAPPRILVEDDLPGWRAGVNRWRFHNPETGETETWAKWSATTICQINNRGEAIGAPLSPGKAARKLGVWALKALGLPPSSWPRRLRKLDMVLHKGPEWEVLKQEKDGTEHWLPLGNFWYASWAASNVLRALPHLPDEHRAVLDRAGPFSGQPEPFPVTLQDRWGRRVVVRVYLVVNVHWAGGEE